MQHSLTPLDIVVLIVYLLGSVAFGVWLGRSQKDSKDYFVGDGKIPWWAIMFSVVATETSALTFISVPGLAYLGNFTFLQVAMGYILGRIFVAAVLLPRYYNGQLVTAYALLEQRFGLATRRFASVTFMFTRAFGNSVRVFVTAIPLALILSPMVSAEWVMPVSIILIGVLTLVYTYHGGMRAVVWTDVLQTGVYLLGGFATLFIIGREHHGGWSDILSQASAAGKLQWINPKGGFQSADTLWAGVFGGAFLSMASHGADQIIVQRLMAAHSLKDARKALIASGFAVFFQFAIFLLIGTGLFYHYQGQTFATPDSIFPKFIIEGLPAGLTGLVIAGILAADMSSLSGALNSLSAATTHDLYVTFTGCSKDDPRLLRVGRFFTLLWAVILIGGALLYKNQSTPVVSIALAIVSFTFGGLLGGFFLAIAWPRARQKDAILGMSLGIISMGFIIFAKIGHIAWPWYVLIGSFITLASGILSSLA